MGTSGEAADQMMKVAVEAGETAVKISGTGAKEIAVILYAMLKDKKKSKGKTRLETLLRSEKPLTVFPMKEKDLQRFAREAKKYGILYCVVKDRKEKDKGMADIVVKEDDASRINRIIERLELGTVLLPVKDEKGQGQYKGNPSQAKADSPHPSERTSEGRKKTNKDSSKKPSVRGELDQIKSKRKEQDSRPRDERNNRNSQNKNRNGKQNRNRNQNNVRTSTNKRNHPKKKQRSQKLR